MSDRPAAPQAADPQASRPSPNNLAASVEAHAERSPATIALRVEGQSVTYAELHEQVARVSAGLAATGVETADLVALILPNCVEFVVSWLALNRIGAVAAPLNTGMTRDGLAEALRQTGARVAVIDIQFRDTLAAILHQAPSLEKVYLTGDHDRGGIGGLEVLSWADLSACGDSVPRRPVAAGDPSIVLFTSGSTSRSKGCVLPHRYVIRQAEIFNEQLGIRRDDVLFCPFPLFHADAAIFTVAPAFVLGATAALVERFSVTRFWDQIRQYKATVFDFMGATLAMLHKQPARPDDADNPARLGWGVPLPRWAPKFEQRFGLDLVEVYGLSDAGIVLYNQPGAPRRLGSCGRPVDPFEVRILDPDGSMVPAGDVGEICIRPREPDVIMKGYLGMPAETLRAFRNLWFHTGDLACQDEDGFVFFVGRSKDIVRRRGENISAFEVEETIKGYPDVLEIAAFGVPSELTEEDLMIAVVPRPGHDLRAEELAAYCEAQLPRHMLPRYIDIVDSLPRTPTEKVEKHRLQAAGVTATTYDRESRPPVDSGEPRPATAGTRQGQVSRQWSSS